MMDISEVRDFWSDRACNASKEGEVTHRDVWQRWLEIETIKKFLDPSLEVVDIGCGNGFTTLKISPAIKRIVGLDYTEQMVLRAKKEATKQNIENAFFDVADVMSLSSERYGQFDLAISERCLINLPHWDAQKKGIENIAGMIKPGGRFLFIEGSADGRGNLNKMRTAVGLRQMPDVWHNIDFEEESLFEYLGLFFEVEQVIHFGAYDYVARVVHPLMVFPDDPQYEAPINKAAAYLALNIQDMPETSNEKKTISRSLFLVLRRKGQVAS